MAQETVARLLGALFLLMLVGRLGRWIRIRAERSSADKET